MYLQYLPTPSHKVCHSFLLLTTNIPSLFFSAFAALLLHLVSLGVYKHIQFAARDPHSPAQRFAFMVSLCRSLFEFIIILLNIFLIHISCSPEKAYWHCIENPYYFCGFDSY